MFIINLLLCLFLLSGCEKDSQPIVYVYNWFGVLTPQILRQFEQETGIKVIYNVYENNEISETRLLTGTFVCDVIFPSAYPYLARQIQAGVYAPLDRAKLPNLRYVDKSLLAKLQGADPNNTYALPFLWGSLGLAYNKEIVRAVLGTEKITSWKVLFDPEMLAKFNKRGVILTDDVNDLVPIVLNYLGFSPNSYTKTALAAAGRLLTSIKPFVTKFAGSQVAAELANNEVCLAQCWSGTAAEAIKLNDSIAFIVPDEGSAMWIDCVAIPKTARNRENAHKFINFLYRPDIMGKISNISRNANSIAASYPYVSKYILKNPVIFPPESVKKRLFIAKVIKTMHQKALNELILKVKYNGYTKL